MEVGVMWLQVVLCNAGSSGIQLRLLSWIHHVNTIEWSHCVTLFSHHSHLCHCSWLYPNVIVILYGHRVKAAQCSGGDYGFLITTQYLFLSTLFQIDLKFAYDKIMYFEGLYCAKVWNHFAISKIEKFINPHWLPWKFWVLKSNFEIEILTHAMV